MSQSTYISFLLSLCLLFHARYSRTPQNFKNDDATCKTVWSDRDRELMKFKPTPNIVVSMAVPALLYTLSNMLSYTVVGLLGSTRYQLYSNMKIIITALTFHCVMGQVLKIVQWACLLFLTVGLTIATKENEVSKEESISGSTLLLGVFMTALLSFASAFAGVFTELKHKNRNM